MKKFAFGFACVLAGCAAGAAMPHVTAQTFAPNPAAPKWQHLCVPLHDVGGRADREAEETQSIANARGAEGWELVTATSDGYVGATVFVCFKRPAPQ